MWLEQVVAVTSFFAIFLFLIHHSRKKLEACEENESSKKRWCKMFQWTSLATKLGGVTNCSKRQRRMSFLWINSLTQRTWNLCSYLFIIPLRDHFIFWPSDYQLFGKVIHVGPAMGFYEIFYSWTSCGAFDFLRIRDANTCICSFLALTKPASIFFV